MSHRQPIRIGRGPRGLWHTDTHGTVHAGPPSRELLAQPFVEVDARDLRRLGVLEFDLRDELEQLEAINAHLGASGVDPVEVPPIDAPGLDWRAELGYLVAVLAMAAAAWHLAVQP